MKTITQVREAGFAGWIGVGRRDITPPVGIYARQWGAAQDEVAGGVHRPLVFTVISFQEEQGEQPLILAAMDGFMFRDPEDEYLIRAALMEGANVGAERVILNISHTHASCSVSSVDADNPGGGLIAPYLAKIRQAARKAVGIALSSAAPSVLTWQEGRCGLARNRDLLEPAGERWICGFNPLKSADDTLLVGRVTSERDGRIRSVIVNYACHPTTLAWDNRLISPDYVGAMREVVERETGAPVAFLQGASGELAPSRQYTGDIAVADANGRALGFAVLSSLTGMLPPQTELAFRGVQESGAPLGLWELQRIELPGKLSAFEGRVNLPLKPQPSEAEVLRELEKCEDRNMRERLHRKRALLRHLGAGPDLSMPFWVWKVGDVAFVAQPNEAYSLLQTELRRRFSEFPVVVMNLANGAAASYLYPAEMGDRNLYQVWVSPFKAEALNLLIDACASAIESELASKAPTEAQKDDDS